MRMLAKGDSRELSRAGGGLIGRASTSKVKKAKKKEKPKLSFEEDEDEQDGGDGGRGPKRSRSPSTGMSINVPSASRQSTHVCFADKQNQDPRNDSPKTQMSIPLSCLIALAKRQNV